MTNKIVITNYYIRIVADSTDTALQELMRVASVELSRSKNTYFTSVHNLVDVLRIFRNITDEAQITDEFIHERYVYELRRNAATGELKRLGPQEHNIKLWAHQELGVEMARVNDRYAFFYDTRTGKTRMAYQIMQEALEARKVKRCVVICPSAIIQDWLSDAKEFPKLKVVAYYGTAKQKEDALKAPAHIILWSLEIAAKSLDLIKSIKFDLCIVDESSKLKSYRAQISKAMLEYSITVPRWYLLSATPAPNGKHEYYIQMRTIDYCMFASARSRFVQKYFNDFSRNPSYEKLVIKPEMEKDFTDRVEEFAMYVDQSVMPLAGKEWHTYEFKLDKDMQEKYERMRKDMSMAVDDTTAITVDMIGIVQRKLTQLASGFIMDTDAINLNKINKKLGEPIDLQEVYRLSVCRRTALEVLLATLGNESVVIWANYTEEFKMINELLGTRAHYIRGGCTTQEKEDYVKDFRQKKVQYLVCHPLSIGMGINLTVAHIAIYYSISDSWEAFKQSSERIAGHIMVQPHKCIYYVLIAEDTVNSHTYKNVMNKKDASADFYQYLKADALKDGETDNDTI